jgi:hypothetical protein
VRSGISSGTTAFYGADLLTGSAVTISAPTGSRTCAQPVPNVARALATGCGQPDVRGHLHQENQSHKDRARPAPATSDAACAPSPISCSRHLQIASRSRARPYTSQLMTKSIRRYRRDRAQQAEQHTLLPDLRAPLSTILTRASSERRYRRSHTSFKLARPMAPRFGGMREQISTFRGRTRPMISSRKQQEGMAPSSARMRYRKL